MTVNTRVTNSIELFSLTSIQVIAVSSERVHYRKKEIVFLTETVAVIFYEKQKKITETNPRQLFCCCCLSAIIDDNIFVQTFCFWQLLQMKNLHLPFFTLTHKKYKFVPSHRNTSSWHKYFIILFLLLTFNGQKYPGIPSANRMFFLPKIIG